MYVYIGSGLRSLADAAAGGARQSPAQRIFFWAGLVVRIVWFGKVRLVGENVTAGDTPTPVSDSVCGLTGALSVMLTAAVLVPVEEGVKVTVMLQLLPAGTDVPQLLVWAKLPLALMPVTVSAAVPVL